MMRNTICFLILMQVAIGSAAIALDSNASIPSERVAVMNLKVTGENSDQLREWLPILIEDTLMQKGWTLLVRGERMQHIQTERSLAGIDPATKIEGDTLYGATAFLELTARIQITGIQGGIGFGRMNFGDYVKVSVDLNGQIVDVRTGTLKSSVKVGGSAGGLKTIAIVALNRDWNVRGGGINLAGIRQSLAGKAADKAALKLVETLDKAYNTTLPKSSTVTQTKLSVTNLPAQASDERILLDFADTSGVTAGARYGVYREEKLVAELEIVKIINKTTAQARVVSGSSNIKPTDKARKMPLTISAE